MNMHHPVSIIDPTYLYACKELLVRVQHDKQLTQTYTVGYGHCEVQPLIDSGEIKIIELSLDKEFIGNRLLSLGLSFGSSQKEEKTLRELLKDIKRLGNRFPGEEAHRLKYYPLTNVTVEISKQKLEQLEKRIDSYQSAFKNGLLVNPENDIETIKSYDFHRQYLLQYIHRLLEQGVPFNNFVISELDLRGSFKSVLKGSFYFLETILAFEHEGLIDIKDIGIKENETIEDVVKMATMQLPIRKEQWGWVRISIAENIKQYFTKVELPASTKDASRLTSLQTLSKDSFETEGAQSEAIQSEEKFSKFGDITINKNTLDAEINGTSIKYTELPFDHRRGLRTLFLLIGKPDLKQYSISAYEHIAQRDRKELGNFLKSKRKISNLCQYGSGSVSRARKLLKQYKSNCRIPQGEPIKLELSSE